MRKFVCTLTTEELYDLFITQQKTLNEMCSIVGVKSPITMAKILRERGIDTDVTNKRRKEKTMSGMSEPEFREYLRRLYQDEKKSINKIAKMIGVTSATIRKYLLQYEIPLLSHLDAIQTFSTGEGAPNWNGGRHIHDGYVEIYCPDHPFANKRKCVYEHRLVVEKKIGRILSTDEHIHHINGIKTDNRIENLLLLSASEHAKIHYKIRGNPKGV